MIIALLLLMISITLSSCLAPKYTVPQQSMPQKFQYRASAGKQEPVSEWWKQFDDSVLNTLIMQAIKTNYDLRIALEKIEESRALYDRKVADMFPKIDVVSDVSRIRLSKALVQNSSFTQDTFSFFSVGFDAFWEIDIWGKLRHAKNAQYFLLQAQIEQMRDVYIILLADVARNYVALSALQKKCVLASERVCLDASLLQLERDLFEAGLASEIAVAQQEQSLATSQDLLKFFQTDLAQTKNRLAVLLGINPEELHISYPSDIPFAHINLEIGIPSELLRRRPDIRQVERQLASSNEAIGQAIAEWFPSFSLLGGLSSAANTTSTWFTGKSLTWNIGPSVTWPLINFGRIKANIMAKESIKRQNALFYSQTIIRALQEVEDFLVAYFNNKAQYAILSRKLQQAVLQEDLIRSQYESGLASKGDLLIAQKNSIDVDFSLTDVKQAVSSNLISLYKALGGGW